MLDGQITIAVTHTGAGASGTYSEVQSCTLKTNSIINEIISDNDDVTGSGGDVTDTNEVYVAQDPSELPANDPNRRTYIVNGEEYEAANIVGNTHGGIAKKEEGSNKFYANVTLTIPQVPFCFSMICHNGNGSFKVTVTYDYGLGNSNPHYSTDTFKVSGNGDVKTFGFNGTSVIRPDSGLTYIVNNDCWFPAKAPGKDTSPIAINVHIENASGQAVNESIALDFIFDSHSPVSSP